MVPTQVMEDCRLRAESEFEQGKPANWTAAVVIVVIWIVLAYLSYLLVRGWF